MNFKPLINLAASAVVYLAATGSLSAQIFAKDDASSYTNPPGNTAWMSLGTSNAGFGFTPWVFTRAGSDFQGFFVSTGDSIGSTNGKYWGHYANGSHADNASVAYRGFTNALSPGTVFKLKWHTLGVGGQDAS